LLETVGALDRLVSAGVAFHLLMLGTSMPAEIVLGSMTARTRPYVAVVPHFVNSDLPSLLADREVFLLPSHFEGFSVALLEAMALAVTPIATSVGGAEAVIVSGVNGVLIPTHSTDALTGAIARMAEDRHHTGVMGLRAKETARDFTWDRVAERTLRWYQQVAGG